MTKLLASTWVGLGVMFLFGCQTITPDDEDQPATPIEVDDAPRALAEQICASMFTCVCPGSTAYADEAACVEQQTERIQLELDTLLDGGSWNAACAGELAKTWSEWACSGWDTAMYTSTYDARVCPIIKGNLGLNADCWTMNLGDSCREGLSCIDQICIESPTLPVPIGDVCEYEWETLPCEAGSYCDWNNGGEASTCVARPEAGDPCSPTSDYLCGSSAYDLICDPDSATCISAPSEGEPCFDQFLCGPGTYCDGGQDFTCQPRKELGDGCGADAVCPVDASCLNAICTADAAAACNLQNWP
jgi:hypothetical protein